jgi:hypothetical protein
MSKNFETIEKELIDSLQFPKADVLDDGYDKIRRNCDLNRALTLGNLEHSKIKIFFEDSISKKVVETTVWGVTDNSVILKQGIGIPINRIYRSA